jgi:hypothetical protein
VGLGRAELVGQILGHQGRGPVLAVRIQAVGHRSQNPRQCRFEHPVVDGVLGQLTGGQFAGLPTLVEGVAQQGYAVEGAGYGGGQGRTGVAGTGKRAGGGGSPTVRGHAAS